MLLNAEMTPKTSARGFWVGETELELRRLKREDLGLRWTMTWKGQWR